MIKTYLSKIKRTKINGVEWEYIAQGKGKYTFLILPGGGQTAQLNFELIEALKNEYKVIAVTILNSDSTNNCCEAINKILEHENANKNLVIYGLSLGGVVAQSYLARNKNKVNALILSHTSAPKSKTYKNKVIRPLQILKPLIPIIPDGLVRFLSSNFAGKVQGQKEGLEYKTVISRPELEEARLFFSKEFRTKYLSKRLIKTWINLHLDFYYNENLDLTNWNGEVLILRTENDPLMQDDGEFKKIYPNAQVQTFKKTGHLTFYYQSERILKIIKDFLKLNF